MLATFEKLEIMVGHFYIDFEFVGEGIYQGKNQLRSDFLLFFLLSLLPCSQIRNS